MREAARKAGYDPNSGACSKIEKRRNVQKRIAYLHQHGVADLLAKTKRMLVEFEIGVMEQDYAEYFETVDEPIFHGGEPVIDANGNKMTRRVAVLKPFDKLTREQRLLVDSLTYTERGRPNLKLYNKHDASDRLRKMLGIDAATKVEQTAPDGVQVRFLVDGLRFGADDKGAAADR